MRFPVVVAALLFVPTMFLHYSHLDEGWTELAEVLDWMVWGTFALEVVGSLVVGRDRRGYVAHHKLAVFVVCFAFPPLPEVFDVVPGLYVLGLLGGFQVVHLAKLTEVAGVVEERVGHHVWWRRLTWTLFLAAAGVVLVAVVGAVVDPEHEGEALTPLDYLGDVLERATSDPADIRLLALGASTVAFVGVALWSTGRGSRTRRPDRAAAEPA
jgi:hypothetical protein